MKYAVITGASTGIGLAGAEALVAGGYHVFGSVRKAADAARVQGALGERFTPLMFDVTDEAAIRAAAAEVEEVVGDAGLAGLVNNAGVAVGGPLLHLSLEEVRWQLEVNVIGVLAVTQAFARLLGARRPSPHPPGRIVNISSVGGQVAAPFVGPYAASKHALEGMSHSLRRELLLYGIDVIIIAPGAVATPIWDKAEAEDRSHVADNDYGPYAMRFQAAFTKQGRATGLPPAALGALIREALEHPRPMVRYAPVPNRMTDWLIPRYLPARWLDRFFRRNVFGG